MQIKKKNEEFMCPLYTSVELLLTEKVTMITTKNMNSDKNHRKIEGQRFWLFHISSKFT